MKAVYLALGLLMTGHALAASITGSIGVRLTLYTQCSVDGRHVPASQQPDIACGSQTEQPKVTQSVIAKRTGEFQDSRLVTVEW